MRRRILELLAERELTAGALTDVVRAGFGISRPAGSRHLRALRESGFATVRPEGSRRVYVLGTAPFDERSTPGCTSSGGFWQQRLDALGRSWPAAVGSAGRGVAFLSVAGDWNA